MEVTPYVAFVYTELCVRNFPSERQVLLEILEVHSGDLGQVTASVPLCSLGSA